jgi:hypothetical protein
MATSVSDADGQDATQYLRSVLSEEIKFSSRQRATDLFLGKLLTSVIAAPFDLAQHLVSYTIIRTIAPQIRYHPGNPG